MTKVQSSQLNALLSVQAHLSLNAELVGTIPALDAASEELAETIIAINANVQVQTSPSGAAQAKREALATLGDIAFEIAGGVLAFADQAGNATLAAKVQYSRSGITTGSSNAIVARCQDIVDATTENLSSLGDHGVTQAKLTALKQRLKAYDTLRTMPRQAKAAAAAATTQLAKLLPKARRMLANRVDKLVWQFRGSAPEFFEKYQTARAIVDAPTPGKDGEQQAA